MLFGDTEEIYSFIERNLRGFAECGGILMTPAQRAQILANSPLVTLERRLREGLLKPRKVLGRSPVEKSRTRSAAEVQSLINLPPRHGDGRRYLDNLQEAYAYALLTVLSHPGPEDWNDVQIKLLEDQLTKIHAIEGDSTRPMRAGKRKGARGDSWKIISRIINDNPTAKGPALWTLLKKTGGVKKHARDVVVFANGSQLKRTSFLAKVSYIKKGSRKRSK
jgi:hypothetical protein